MPERHRTPLDRWIDFLQKRPVPFLILFAALSVWGMWSASRLKFVAAFTELLPPHLQSVIDLEEINERIGGSSNFIVVIENDDFDASKAYAEALVERLQRDVPPGYIRYIDYNNSNDRRFFETHKYLYAEVEDLEAIHDRLKKKIEWDLTCKNAFFLDFTGQCKKDPGFDMSDIQKKYESEELRFDQHKEGYYTNETADLMAILIKPKGDSSAVEVVRDFLATVLPIIESVDPTPFDPDLKIHYTGSYAQADEELRTMIEDARNTGVSCVVLVLLVLFLYYGNFRTIFFISASVFAGLTWSYGLAYPLVGVLTSQTALMGSIVLGNGINNAIIFLARYIEERRGEIGAEEALRIAARTTIGATFTAAFTTAAAFAVLGIARMRAYTQFGIIGSVGMVACWIAAYSVLPALVALVEKLRPLSPERTGSIAPNFSKRMGRLVARYPRPLAYAGFALTLAGIVGSAFFWNDPFEHDYSNIRSQTSLESGSAYWNRRLMDEVFNLSLTPSVMLAEDRAQAEEVRQALLKKRDADPDTVIDTVRTLDAFVPENQPEKLEWMEKIRKLLEGQAAKFLKPSQRKELDRIKEGFDLKPVTEEDIPISVTRHFEEKDGTRGRVVYIFPDNSRWLWLTENVLKFTVEATRAELPDGRVVTGSGEAVIVGDLLHIIHTDAGPIIFAAFGGVLLFLLLKFRNPVVAGKVFLPLAAAYLWLGMFLEIFGIRITFINFIVFPMAIGIGIDYAANVFHRYELEGEGSIEAVLETTGGAVMLCSLTTAIGYAALLIAQSRAMMNLGKLGLLSELCTVTGAVLFAPAVLVLLEKRRNRTPRRGDSGT